MLKEITISNYKSINGELTLSMEADYKRVGEHPNHIIDVNDNKILKIASMYGPNGGGKTNILTALELAKVVFSNIQTTLIRPSAIDCVFNDNKEVEETLFFVDKKYEVGYSFKIIPTITTKPVVNQAMPVQSRVYCADYEVVEETLSYRKAGEEEFISLFERYKDGTVDSEELKKLGILNNIRLSKNISLLNYLYTNFANNSGEMPEPLSVVRFLGNELNSITPLEYLINVVINDSLIDLIMNNKERLISSLKAVDINIDNIKIYHTGSYYPIFFERTINCNNEQITKEIALSDESLGTQKIFWIFVNLINLMKSNHIVVSDDMNSFLHPKLSRAIVELFGSDSNNKCQLIFNSHDLLNMDSELFRRDEIWFVYRDENYSSKITPLSSIVNYKGEQVRKDAKYCKQYLEGRYGADPFIKKGLNWDA